MLGAADDSPLIKPFAKALDLEIPSKAAILCDPDGDEFREDAAGAVLNDADKIVVVDFFSWDPLPWLESWDLTAYGSAGIMPSRPLPASYKIYDTGKTGAAEGWTEWDETSFPINWASTKTEYSPELAEIDNPAFFDREAAVFINSLRSGTPSVIPAGQAYGNHRVDRSAFCVIRRRRC